jgi:hypothetical protein
MKYFLKATLLLYAVTMRGIEPTTPTLRNPAEFQWVAGTG